MSDVSIKPDPYAPWRSRNYRRYAYSWFGMVFSKQIETLAVSVYFVNIYDPQQAPLALGILGLVQALPVMLLSIAGGQIADRCNRRHVMMATLSVSTLVSIGLVIVALTSGSAPLMYLLLGLGAIAQALGGPSRSALLPQLVSTEFFANAVAWSSTIFYLGSVTGPAVGGGIMAVWEHPAVSFAVVGACRVLSLAALTALNYRPADRPGQSISWQSVVAGVRFVRDTKLILATISLDLFAVLLGGVTYLLPIFAKDILHVGPLGLGFLRSADAVGAMCMAMALVHLPPMRRAGVMLLWAVAGYGMATIVFGLSPWFWLSLAMMFLIGGLDNISVVVRHTLLQMLTPDAMRGRVLAVSTVFIVASNDLGGLESGLTAWLFGPIISAVGGGVCTIFVVLTAIYLWPEILGLGSLVDIRPAAEEEPSNV
jgi:MFS family permease/drug/metabolite transporter superfamily protein YnfA